MGKKVCHITSTHSRYDVRIFIKECASLAQNGYDVTLIVNDNETDETNKGVRIISTKLKPKNRLERFLKSINLLFAKAIEVDADLYHLHDPDLLLLGNKLKRRRKKVIFDCHEDVPNQIIDKFWIPSLLRGIVSKVYVLYERYSLKKYDAIISVTPHIVERLSKINPNTVMITNYPIIDFDNRVHRNPMNAICFAGGINAQWNHDKILKALENINNVKYILAGIGTKDYLDYLRTFPGWRKVDYVGRVPHEEVKNIYSKSIAGVALNFSNQIKIEGTLGNTKLFEYMAAGLPVICSDYRLWREIVEKNNCGICINPNSVEEITEAIEYIMSNPKKAAEMGENGKKAVIEKYNWITQEKKLIDLYNNL